MFFLLTKAKLGLLEQIQYLLIPFILLSWNLVDEDLRGEGGGTEKILVDDSNQTTATKLDEGSLSFNFNSRCLRRN